MIFQPTFFAPVIQYVYLSKTEQIRFEQFDNFQKQTYRNRCYIYGANGMQLLTVPIKHTKSNSNQKTKDVEIDHSFNWRRNMIKSLEASYRSSPFFEFYEDDIIEVFEKKHRFLLDLNLQSFEVIEQCLQSGRSYEFTTEFQLSYDKAEDQRILANAKTASDHKLEPYTQVFESKHGFIPNLSILDLLFNEGTAALDYLERQKTECF